MPTRVPVLAAGRVGGVEVGEEGAVGPLVGGDVVQDDGDHVLVRAEPEHLAAQREFGGQVEGAALGGLDQRGQFVLGAVDDRGDGMGVGGRDDPLVRLALVGREHRPQRLVPSGDVP